MGGHENDRILRPQRGELFLKVKPRHSRKPDIQDKAAFTRRPKGAKEVFRGIEGADMIIPRGEQSLERPLDGIWW